MALCADSATQNGDMVGDPTEGALIVLAAERRHRREGASAKKYPRMAELPFDSDYKFMATFHKMKDEQGKPVVRCYVKGAPDVILGRAARRPGQRDTEHAAD